MSKRRKKEREKCLEDLPSDVVVYEIFRFCELYEVYYVFSQLNKYIRTLCTRSMIGSMLKMFEIVYFPEHPELNISVDDCIHMIEKQTFDTSSCGFQVLSYLALNGYVDPIKKLLTVLPGDKLSWEAIPIPFFEIGFDSKMTKFINDADLDENEVHYIDTDFKYEDNESDDSDDEEEDEKNEESSGDEALGELVNDEEQNEINYSIFYHPEELKKTINTVMEAEDFENEVFCLCLDNNDSDILEQVSTKLKGINFRSQKYIKISLIRNNDPVSLYLVKELENEITNEFDVYFDILDHALQSECPNTLEFLFEEDRMKKVMKILPDYSGCYYDMKYVLGRSYFNSFFFGRNHKSKDGKRLITRMIENDDTEDFENEEENEYSEVLSENFYERFVAGIDTYFQIMYDSFKFPIDRKRYNPHYDFENEHEYHEAENEEEKKQNSEYQDESFFEKEEQEEQKENEGGRIRDVMGRSFFRRYGNGRNNVNNDDFMKVLRKSGVFACGPICKEEVRNGFGNLMHDLIKRSVIVNGQRRSAKFDGEEDVNEVIVRASTQNPDLSVKELRWSKKNDRMDDEDEDGNNNDLDVSEEDVKFAIESFMKTLPSEVQNRMRRQMEGKKNDMSYLKGTYNE